MPLSTFNWKVFERQYLHFIHDPEIRAQAKKWATARMVEPVFAAQYKGFQPLDTGRDIYKGISEEKSQEIQSVIDYYEDSGVVERARKGDVKVFGEVFILVKPSGDPRLIANCQTGNEFTDCSAFQLPNQLSPLVHGDCWGAKLDLSAAFMHFPITRRFRKYLGFKGPSGQQYRWKRLAWGSNVSPYVMQSIMQSLINRCRVRNRSTRVFVYLDDIGIFGRRKTDVQETVFWLTIELERLGLTINEKKCVREPTNQMEWLGLQINMTPTRPELTRCSVPEQKKSELRTQLFHLLKYRNVGALIKFIGQANFLCLVTPAARKSLNKLNAFIPAECRVNRELHNEKVYISGKTEALLRAVTSKVTAKTSYMVFLHDRQIECAVDASDHHAGISSLDSEFTCSIPFAGDLWKRVGLGPPKDENILLKEMYSVLVAVKHAPRDSTLRVHCDNQAVIYAVSKRYCRMTRAYPLLDCIYKQLRNRRIALTMVYIKTDDNPADAPSRELHHWQYNRKIVRTGEPILAVARITECFKEPLEIITRQEMVDFSTTNLGFYQPEAPSTFLEAKLGSATGAKVLSLRMTEVLENYQNFNMVTRSTIARLLGVLIYWDNGVMEKPNVRELMAAIDADGIRPIQFYQSITRNLIKKRKILERPLHDNISKLPVEQRVVMNEDGQIVLNNPHDTIDKFLAAEGPYNPTRDKKRPRQRPEQSLALAPSPHIPVYDDDAAPPPQAAAAPPPPEVVPLPLQPAASGSEKPRPGEPIASSARHMGFVISTGPQPNLKTVGIRGKPVIQVDNLQDAVIHEDKRDKHKRKKGKEEEESDSSSSDDGSESMSETTREGSNLLRR